MEERNSDQPPPRNTQTVTRRIGYGKREEERNGDDERHDGDQDDDVR